MPDQKSVIPDYNEQGQLPPGIYRPTLNEFIERFIVGFPTSKTRKEHFSGYTQYCSTINQLGPCCKITVTGLARSLPADGG